MEHCLILAQFSFIIGLLALVVWGFRSGHLRFTSLVFLLGLYLCLTYSISDIAFMQTASFEMLHNAVNNAFLLTFSFLVVSMVSLINLYALFLEFRKAYRLSRIVNSNLFNLCLDLVIVFVCAAVVLYVIPLLLHIQSIFITLCYFSYASVGDGLPDDLSFNDFLISLMEAGKNIPEDKSSAKIRVNMGQADFAHVPMDDPVTGKKMDVICMHLSKYLHKNLSNSKIGGVLPSPADFAEKTVSSAGIPTHPLCFSKVYGFGKFNVKAE